MRLFGFTVEFNNISQLAYGNFEVVNAFLDGFDVSLKIGQFKNFMFL
jgi:hypothetical protein